MLLSESGFATVDVSMQHHSRWNIIRIAAAVAVVWVPWDARAKDAADDPARKGAELLESASLIKYGFTFGIAGVAITNKGLGKHRQQDDVGITAMPYVSVSPAYVYRLMRGAGITNAYCATKAISLNAHTAQVTANAEAKRQARKSYDGGKVRFDGLKGAQLSSAIFKETGWNIAYAGRCGLTWVTVFGGFPASYDANFKDTEVHSREATARGAFGLSFTPMPYFSLLFGVSRIAVKYVDADDSSKLKFGWAYVAGVGGNVDIFGDLFK